MTNGEIVFTVIGLIVSSLAAIFAWVQAKAAVSSRDDAVEAQLAAESARDEALELSRKATAAAERQAEALETSNRLAIEAKTPPVLTPRYSSDTIYPYVNSSNRDIEVLSYEVLPASESKFIRLYKHPEPPFVVPMVEALTFTRIRAAGARPEAIQVHYRFVGEDVNRRIKISVV